MSKASPNESMISKRKRVIFAIFSFAIPFLILLTVEGVLRQAGFGGYPPLIRHVIDTPEGSLYVVDHQKARSYFFANRDRPGYNNQYSFFLPKPKDTVRILLAGGSAIQGYPQPRQLIAAEFLREMLQQVWPDRRVEVLDIGTTAAASFPVMEMSIEALLFEPDLVVVYAGHNEFFGTYGVASINRFIAHPAMLKMHRWVRGLAVVQAIERFIPARGEMNDRTLMEIMVGKQYTPANHWTRSAAANQLNNHIGHIIRACTKRDIPVMVCTLPSNERDLAPLGDEMWLAEGEKQDAEATAAFDRIVRKGAADPEDAIKTLNQLLDTYPDSARLHYQKGQMLFEADRFDEAGEAFIAARDLDTMPWRATSQSQEGILQAAKENDAMVCDVEQFFRDASPGGSIGWELMDDHVHPSLAGQDMLARAIVERLTHETGKLAVSPEAYARLLDPEVYAQRLGDNPFDRYTVDHQIRVLFNIPFMRNSNPRGWQRYEQRARTFERSLPPELSEVVLKWQSRRPHAGAARPLTGMIARALMRRGNYTEAQRLFQIAQRSVPEYSSWHMEYLYFDLACEEKINGSLSDEDKRRAAEEIECGRILLAHGYSGTGLTERYTGRLYQLRGEYEEAIPFLQAARTMMTGFDLVAVDQALVLSYVNTGNLDQARKLADYGASNSGQYADYYRKLLDNLETIDLDGEE